MRQAMKAAVISVMFVTIATASAVVPTYAQSREERLKPLLATAGLTPWTWRKHAPTDWELPDASGKLRSLARDFRDKVVLLYMFAEW